MNFVDIQIKSQPFTKEKLRKIKKDLHSGKIRRFGAIVDHQRLSFSHNALVAWAKPPLNKLLIKKLKEKDFISHIYLRKAHRLWPFGLYTMVHARTRQELDSYMLELFRLLGERRFKILNTVKEFKKTSFNPYL